MLRGHKVSISVGLVVTFALLVFAYFSLQPTLLQKAAKLAGVSQNCIEFVESQLAVLRHEISISTSNQELVSAEMPFSGQCSEQEMRLVGVVVAFSERVARLIELEKRLADIEKGIELVDVYTEKNRRLVKFSVEMAKKSTCIIETDRAKGTGVLATESLTCRFRAEACTDIRVLTAYHVVNDAKFINIRCGDLLAPLKHLGDEISLHSMYGEVYRPASGSFRDVVILKGNFGQFVQPESQVPIFVHGISDQFEVVSSDASYIKSGNSVSNSDERQLGGQIWPSKIVDSLVKYYDVHFHSLPPNKKVGAKVYLVGYPLHSDSFSVVEGSITSVDWREKEFDIPKITISSPAAPGMSGGAVYDEFGVFIGVLSGARKNAQIMNVVEEFH